MKKSYIHPAIEIRFSEVDQMMALSIMDGNATNDDALAKSSNWDIWNDEAGTEE